MYTGENMFPLLIAWLLIACFKVKLDLLFERLAVGVTTTQKHSIFSKVNPASIYLHCSHLISRHIQELS